MQRRRFALFVVIGLYLISLQSCGGFPGAAEHPPAVERESKIPADAEKMSPTNDEHPPVLLTGEYENPIPVPGKVNTAGGEDSPFISEDGGTLYFFFTPDIQIPADKQVLDGVTGIYVSRIFQGEWRKPERIFLQDADKLAMDGCAYIHGNRMWFCSAREGYEGLQWFTAEFQEGGWRNWQPVTFPPDFEVGELHFSADGQELYFASARSGGEGQLDIWMSKNQGGAWQQPVNLASVNTDASEGWPALNPAGDELWFSRNFGIWRSSKVNGEWQAPEQIVSNLAGEPSIDREGNLYFVHHYLQGNEMIEADIYMAYKKK